MTIVLVGTGLGLIALPWATRRFGRRLAPEDWARRCAYALVSGVAVLELALSLYALPTVLRAIGVPVLADMCERMLRPFLPGGATAGWAASAVAVMMPLLGAFGVIRARRVQRSVHAEPWLGEHRSVGGYELVVLPSDQLLAVSVDGPQPQVIISRGLLDTLDAREVELVLRHETAHLDNRHQRFLLLATAIEHGLAFFPPASRSTAALRVALERWADEEAAGEESENRSGLSAALLGMTSALVVPDVAAFSPADTVVERLDALQHPPTRARMIDHLLIGAPAAALSGGLLVALVGWADHARMLLAMSGRCSV